MKLNLQSIKEYFKSKKDKVLPNHFLSIEKKILYYLEHGPRGEVIKVNKIEGF